MVVHGHDSLCTVSDLLLDFSGIDIKRSGVYIDEHWNCIVMEHGGRRSKKGQCGHQYFITRFRTDAGNTGMQRSSTAVQSKAIFHTRIICILFFPCDHLRIIFSPEVFALNNPLYRLHILSGYYRPIG